MRRVLLLVSALAACAAALIASPASAQTAPERVVISVSGIQQSGTSTVTSTVAFTANAESATFSSTFPVKSGPGFDAGVRIAVRGPLGISLAASQFSASGNADVTAKIPHPFFFNQARSIAGTVGMKREETAVRVALVLSSAPGRKLQASAFAGPAFFTVKQDLVASVTYTDAYPYDTAAFGGATTTQVSKSKTGFAAGADVSYFFAKSVGIGASVAVVKATISASASDGSTVNVNAGGTQVGAGLRFRF
jgi:hypothetical protein